MRIRLREANQRVSVPMKVEATLQRVANEGRARLAEIPGPVHRGRWRPLPIKGRLSAALRGDRAAR
jgi:hypothetical protein